MDLLKFTDLASLVRILYSNQNCYSQGGDDLVTKTALVYILESVFDLNDLYGSNITSNSCVLLYEFQDKTRCC
jgi:hypothetical protein